MNRVIVLSDLHFAPPGPLSSFRAAAELAGLLREVGGGSTTLVLAGDTLDLLQEEGHPGVVDLEGAASRVRRCLAGFGAMPKGRAVLDALADAVRAGTRCVVLPGNHDPELAHPLAERALREALGLDGDDERLSVHRSGDTWCARVGRWDVVIGHGNRSDAFNDVDPAAVRAAIAAGRPSVPLNPGSRLVVDALNAFKRACDPDDGRPRFPFLDALKPEIPGVPLLLLYLDPVLASRTALPVLGIQGPRALLRWLRGRLRGGPTLADAAGAEPSPVDPLGHALAGSLSPSEREAPDATLRGLEAALLGARGPAAGSLATHGGPWRPLLRAAVYALAGDRSHFQPGTAGSVDAAIIREHLPPGSGPRVVIAGHTHAAREIPLEGERLYLNTGSWTDLLNVPTDLPPLAEVLADPAGLERLDARLKGWIDAMEAGEIAPLRRLSYAEVTAAEGPRLRWWRPDPVLAVLEGNSG